VTNKNLSPISKDLYVESRQINEYRVGERKELERFLPVLEKVLLYFT